MTNTAASTIVSQLITVCGDMGLNTLRGHLASARNAYIGGGNLRKGLDMIVLVTEKHLAKSDSYEASYGLSLCNMYKTAVISGEAI